MHRAEAVVDRLLEIVLREGGERLGLRVVASVGLHRHEAVREGGSIRVVPADEQKSDEAEFLMLKDGVVHFEGNAAELRASKDSYIRTFLS